MYRRHIRETRCNTDGTVKHVWNLHNFHPDVTRSRKDWGFLHLSCTKFPPILTETKKANTTLQSPATTEITPSVALNAKCLLDASQDQVIFTLVNYLFHSMTLPVSYKCMALNAGMTGQPWMGKKLKGSGSGLMWDIKIKTRLLPHDAV